MKNKKQLNEIKRLQRLAGIKLNENHNENHNDEEYKMGDTIEIDTKQFPNFEFPYGTKGVIYSIDKQDHASDKLVYMLKLKHIDSQGDHADYIFIENSKQIK